MNVVTSINPANGQKVAEFPSVKAEEMEQLAARGRQAQATWRSSSLDARRDNFLRLASLIEDRATEIIDLMHTETGKLHADGEPEVQDVAAAVRHHLDRLSDLVAARPLELDEGAFPGTSATLSHEPYGVIGLIMPWNFPFYVPSIFAICAVLAGNAVVVKPSEHSTMIAYKIAELFADAGFDPNLVQVAAGGDETGRCLVKSPVDKIFFVGSIEAGEDIIRNAGTTPVQVELGGNSAAIILDDTDIGVAVAGVAWGGTYHAGQDCMAVKRIFVHRAVATEFVDQLTALVSGLRPGVDYGPYISIGAVTEAKRRVDAAVSEGAKLLCGGQLDSSSGGYWMTPSVLLVQNQEFDVVKTETFGNVLPVQVVDSDEEAIALTNDTPYGLSNAIFSTNMDRARAIGARLESGMVFINDPFVTTPGWDYAVGWKSSGFGTMETKLSQCLRGRLTTVNHESQAREFWYPY